MRSPADGCTTHRSSMRLKKEHLRLNGKKQNKRTHRQHNILFGPLPECANEPIHSAFREKRDDISDMQKACLLGHSKTQTSNLRASEITDLRNIPRKCKGSRDDHVVIFKAVSLHCSTKESNGKINKLNIGKFVKMLHFKNSQKVYCAQRCLQKGLGSGSQVTYPGDPTWEIHRACLSAGGQRNTIC